jgi:hypothetical protein
MERRSRNMVRLVLRELQQAGKVGPLGRGPEAPCGEGVMSLREGKRGGNMVWVNLMPRGAHACLPGVTRKLPRPWPCRW